MSEEDINDLWSTVNGLRKELSTVLIALGRIEAMLGERCEVRGQAMVDLKNRVQALEYRVWWASGFAAAIGVLAGWVIK